LLHLIQQHELDIRDIPISFISEKYVEYIMLMQNLNIDLASEYLVMAATLAHIKSKMLLPKPPIDQDDESLEELDPRSELVRRLLEYQKYKNAAEQLGGAPVLGRDVFLRGAPAPMVDGPAPLAQVSVFKLFDAFQKLLSRAKQQADHLIDVDRISISERIIELTDLLRGRGRVAFADLFDETMTRSDLIVSFLAVLEMTRLRMMMVLQDGPLRPIEIELTLAEEHDEILGLGPEGADALLARGDTEHAPTDEPQHDGAEDENSD
jgi:segregation and condensation protein A